MPVLLNPKFSDLQARITLHATGRVGNMPSRSERTNPEPDSQVAVAKESPKTAQSVSPGRACVVITYTRLLQLTSLRVIGRTLPTELTELIIAAVGIPSTISELSADAFDEYGVGYTVCQPAPRLHRVVYRCLFRGLPLCLGPVS